MARFEYHCVEIPGTFEEVVSRKKNVSATETYESIINAEASEGWELDKIDTISTTQKRGCLSGGVVHTRKIAVFRRPAGG